MITVAVTCTVFSVAFIGSLTSRSSLFGHSTFWRIDCSKNHPNVPCIVIPIRIFPNVPFSAGPTTTAASATSTTTTTTPGQPWVMN